MAINAAWTGPTEHEVTARDVSWEVYMERFAADFFEWDNGLVIKMSPVDEAHDRLTRYLVLLLEAYMAMRRLGQIRQAPFVMRLASINKSREPDLQVILRSNPCTLTRTYMDGPADLCIEVVSRESAQRDHGEKFIEYETAGVGEYWIIDPLRKECRFYRLDETKKAYLPQLPDTNGNYRTPILPSLVLNVPTLLEDKQPDFLEIGKAVQAMMAEN